MLAFTSSFVTSLCTFNSVISSSGAPGFVFIVGVLPAWLGNGSISLAMGIRDVKVDVELNVDEDWL